MVRRNGRVHFYVLRPSPPDTVALCRAVEERFLGLCGSWLRIRGERLPIPADLDRDMYLWRVMRHRHKGGDFRNTEAELKALRAVAQFTLDRNCELRGQPPIVMDWGS